MKKTDFPVAEMPHAKLFELHIRHRWRRRSPDHQRADQGSTGRSKSRGVKLGGDRGYRPDAASQRKAAEAASIARGEHATTRAFAQSALIAELQADGVTSLNGLALALNERGAATPRGDGQMDRHHRSAAPGTSGGGRGGLTIPAYPFHARPSSHGGPFSLGNNGITPQPIVARCSRVAPPGP